MIHNWLNNHTQKGLIGGAMSIWRDVKCYTIEPWRDPIQHFIHKINEDMICIAKADSQCKRGVQNILTGCINERNLRRGTLWKIIINRVPC